MRQVKTIALVFGFAAASAAGYGLASAQNKYSAELRQALDEAMREEAFSAAKYKLFAERARKAGNNELADLMTVTSNIEFGHFLRWAGLYGLVGAEAKNLQSAIEHEGTEDINRYSRLSTEAVARGDQTLADFFSAVKAQEEGRRIEMEKAVEKMQSKN